MLKIFRRLFFPPVQYIIIDICIEKKNIVSDVSACIAEPCFFADSGHYFLAQGLTHINGVPVIENSLQNEERL
jgi:hypothetical protein